MIDQVVFSSQLISLAVSNVNRVFVLSLLSIPRVRQIVDLRFGLKARELSVS